LIAGLAQTMEEKRDQQEWDGSINYAGCQMKAPREKKSGRLYVEKNGNRGRCWGLLRADGPRLNQGEKVGNRDQEKIKNWKGNRES